MCKLETFDKRDEKGNGGYFWRTMTPLQFPVPLEKNKRRKWTVGHSFELC